MKRVLHITVIKEETLKHAIHVRPGDTLELRYSDEEGVEYCVSKAKIKKKCRFTHAVIFELEGGVGYGGYFEERA